jgi:hypothetical protein
MTNWDALFQNLSDVEKDKTALLRIIECTNGIIQHMFRSEDADALTLEETREAMKFSMKCMKTMTIPVGEETITFAPETTELFTKVRRLYISGAKNNNTEDFNEFLKASKASLLAVGKERILLGRQFAFNYINELPPHTLEWGLSYIFSFAEWRGEE